ncbi:GGDEF domain-containing protein [Paenarthrobacter nitroguajacolicus]|uniref:GGDEF domain-containing protein n=1 Tax=Paenarthrobacter nitroguajacolicus TaxID=211146 RepID=A0A558H0X2_PAENT|nr:GGDEF domain-containing protein [Paenarthrobacter nitroguajacolicus]TVU62742.1 GGDEF domain-containing protein [Paenarthrobacter nitroguajacolicus]
MVLDAFSVRVALGVVTVTLLVLFCISFHRTRSPYAGWWSVALLEFMVGNAAFLLNGTAHQQWANPVGNVLVVAGAFSVWAGALTLRDMKAAPWQLAVAPVVTAVASVLESPGTNVWSGGFVYLAMMTVGIALAAKDLWFIKAAHSQVHKALSVAAGLLAAYYLARWLVYALEGPTSDTFRTYFGPGPSGLISMVLLVTVSFSMTALTSDQLIKGLKERATRDHLTGLLNRGAFLDLAATELNRLHATDSGAAVVLADLDHFKAVNDEHGHGAGDAALKAFAEACTASVRSTDLIGRYGGEEFILFLPGATQERAESIAVEISRRMASTTGPEGVTFPTVSYGLTSSIPAAADLTFLIEVADAALYSAKAQGRNRIVGADRLQAATIADEARS